MDEDILRGVAEKCARQIVKYAGHRGFTHSDFLTRVPAYNRLSETFPDEGRKAQFRVLVILAKHREIASILGPNGGWHFYARAYAPEGAYHYEERESKADAIRRAIDSDAK